MTNYALFKYRFDSAELELGGRPLKPKDAIETVMWEDWRRINRFNFTSAKGKFDFKREYMWTPENDGAVSVFKFGYERQTRAAQSNWSLKNKMDFPHCVIVVSLKKSSPYILVWGYKKAFKSADEVIEIFGNALNGSFKGSGIFINISPCDKNDEEAKHWMDYMFKVYKQARKHKEATLKALDMYEDIKLHREPSSFRSCVVNPEKADQIIALIRKYMKDKTEAKDLFMPVAAAIDAEVIRNPSWKEMSSEFLLSDRFESSYYRLIREGCKTYSKSFYDKMVKAFKAI